MTALPPHDATAASALWRDYAAAHPERIGAHETPPVEAFGDSVELADDLLALVIGGRKRATATVLEEIIDAGDPLIAVGGHWMVRDGAGIARVVLRTTELRLGVLESVDDAFAWDEGEGDRSRADWLEQHRRYFIRSEQARGSVWREDKEIVFERFRVVWPPPHAD